MSNQATTVVIASHSPIARSRLSRSLAESGAFDVVGAAANLSEAYVSVEAQMPKFVIISPHLAMTPEFECMVALFREIGSQWALLRDGYSDEVCLAPSLRDLAVAEIELGESPASIALKLRNGRRQPVSPGHMPPPRAEAGPALDTDKVILIGASTGGIDALLTILATLPRDCPPVGIVQHTGRGFSDSLVRLLGRSSSARVVAARDGAVMTPGTVHVAGGTEGHFRLRPGNRLICEIQPGPPISGHMPSVDALFRSAVPLGPRVIAAILTGMGRDGADGLLDLRRAGALTLGQDQATSVIYGMPRAAHEIGAVARQLPIDRFGAEILRACGSTQPGSRMM